MVSRQPPRLSASLRLQQGWEQGLAPTRTAQQCGLGQGAQGWSWSGAQPPSPASNTRGSTRFCMWRHWFMHVQECPCTLGHYMHPYRYTWMCSDTCGHTHGLVHTYRSIHNVATSTHTCAFVEVHIHLPALPGVHTRIWALRRIHTHTRGLPGIPTHVNTNMGTHTLISTHMG